MTTESEKIERKSEPYCQNLGELIYLSTSKRPKIAAVVSMIGKYQADLGPNHWKELKNVLRYVKGTCELGVIIHRLDKAVGLEAWSDADWACDLSKRHERYRYIVTYDSEPVLWSQKLQMATDRSTTEA